MTLNSTFAVLFLILSCVISLRAQPAAVQQLENTQQAQQQQIILSGLKVGTNAPELYQGENEDIGPQRILRLNPRPVHFDVLADSQVFFTDNANFAQNPDMIPSAVFVNTIQFAFTPPPATLGSGKFAPAAGFASQWYNYWNNRMSAFDFEAQTFFLNGKYTIGNWQVGAGANYTRLVNQANYEQTYQEFMPTFGVQRIFALNDNLLIAIGDQLDYHLTQVPSVLGSRSDINDRLDDAINLTFSWQMTRHLIFQPYYRFQYSHYNHATVPTTDRDDYLHTFGVTLVYYFNKNLSARTFFNYNRKQSDDPFTAAYHEYDSGLGASLEFKF
jgi:hypothetical protein